MTKNRTSYPNQKDNSKPPKVVLKSFKKILQNAQKDNNILSWQDACYSIGWRATKCDYWADKLPVFGDIKKEVKNIIISRVNKGAIKGKFVPAPSIWRMKQCGERDEKDVNNKHSGLNQLSSIFDEVDEQINGEEKETE
jgi:hypothetical protein